MDNLRKTNAEIEKIKAETQKTKSEAFRNYTLGISAIITAIKMLLS